MDLEKEVARLNQQNRALKRRNQGVKAENELLKSQIARLKEELGEERALVYDLRFQLQAERHRLSGAPDQASCLLGALPRKRKQECSSDPRPLKKPTHAVEKTLSKEEGEVSDEELQTIPAKSPLEGRANAVPDQSTVTSADNLLTLPSSDVQLYLQDSPKVDVSPPPLRTTMKRQTIRAAFSLSGSPPGPYFERIPEERNPSGDGPRNLWFINSANHPAAPSSPGESGIIFKFYLTQADPTLHGEWSVFRRWTNKTYMYLGEYENAYVEPLSKEQFCAQKYEVQMHWAQMQMQLLKKMQYSPLKARIALRKQGVYDEVQMATMIADGLPVNAPEIDVNDVLETYRRGYERVIVVHMKFVRYDHDFIAYLDKACVTVKHLAKVGKASTGNTTQTAIPQPAFPAATSPAASRSNTHATPVSALPAKPPPSIGIAAKTPLPTTVAAALPSHCVKPPNPPTAPATLSCTKVSTSSTSVPLRRSPSCIEAGASNSRPPTSTDEAAMIARRPVDGASQSQFSIESRESTPADSAALASIPAGKAGTAQHSPMDTTQPAVVMPHLKTSHQDGQLAPASSSTRSSPNPSALQSLCSSRPPIPTTTPPPLPPIEPSPSAESRRPLNTRTDDRAPPPSPPAPPTVTAVTNSTAPPSQQALWNNISLDESIAVWEEDFEECEGLSDVSELEYP